MGESRRGPRAPTSPPLPCTTAGGRAGNAGPRGGLSSSGSWPGLHLNAKPQPWLGGILFPWKREQAGNEENAAPLVSVLPNAEGSGRHFPVGLGLRSIVPGHHRSRGCGSHQPGRRRACPEALLSGWETANSGVGRGSVSSTRQTSHFIPAASSDAEGGFAP